MIHNVTIDRATAAILRQAATDTGLDLLDFEAWILVDWAQTYQRKQQARTEFIDALRCHMTMDTAGVVPGGD